MKLTIEIELQPNMEELLIDHLNDYCMDWFGKKPVLHKTDVVRSKIEVGDRVRVEKGNRSIYTVQHIKGAVVWFKETNDSCFVEECTKVE